MLPHSEHRWLVRPLAFLRATLATVAKSATDRTILVKILAISLVAQLMIVGVGMLCVGVLDITVGPAALGAPSHHDDRNSLPSLREGRENRSVRWASHDWDCRAGRVRKRSWSCDSLPPPGPSLGCFSGWPGRSAALANHPRREVSFRSPFETRQSRSSGTNG
ncbi:MAG: hypothetical protein IPN71_12340 [Fibrobacteres bacterium]|nr:hypothetical protein [Fibrobacterota bacterium]